MKLKRIIPIDEENGIMEEREISLYQDGNFNQLLMGFKKAVDKYNTSVVMIFDGRSGMGKTTLANQTGLTLDENYGLQKIHFSPKTFLEGSDYKVGLANAKKGDFILFDEAMIISNRSAMSQINKMIIQAMSMIRSKNIYVGFCVNSIFDLDKNLVLHRADALFHVYGETLINRGRFCSFFKGRDGQDRLKELFLYGKKYYSYGKPKANFVASFSKEFIVDENNYEKQKQVGINEFLGGKDKRYFERQNYIFNAFDIGYNVKQITDLFGISIQQVYEWRRKWNEYHRRTPEIKV